MKNRLSWLLYVNAHMHDQRNKYFSPCILRRGIEIRAAHNPHMLVCNECMHIWRQAHTCEDCGVHLIHRHLLVRDAELVLGSILCCDGAVDKLLRVTVQCVASK